MCTHGTWNVLGIAALRDLVLIPRVWIFFLAELGKIELASLENIKQKGRVDVLGFVIFVHFVACII